MGRGGEFEGRFGKRKLQGKGKGVRKSWLERARWEEIKRGKVGGSLGERKRRG